MTVTDALLAPLLAADPARPLVTFYDDARGERIECSGQTFDNWVAKTANLLRDECDVEPGTPVAVLLPAHWQTAAVLFGAWACGAQVVASAGDAEVALADAEHLDEASVAESVVGLSLDAFGRGLDEDLLRGAIDYAGEVRLHGDHFAPLNPIPDTAPALERASVAEVVATARNRSAALELTPSDRVLSTLDWPLEAGRGLRGGLVDGLLAVFAAGASLVQVRHPGDLDRTARTERTTRRM